MAKSPLEHPLVVDLDDTLVRADTLVEQLISLVAMGPLIWFKALQALMKGRKALKALAARLSPIDAAHLPYNADVLELLKAQKAEGRPLVLATAASRSTADAVADHLQLFDTVLASDDQVNLKGRKKAAALVDHFGEGGFDYVGDAVADKAIWQHAKGGYAVCRTERQAEKLLSDTENLGWFKRAGLSLKLVLKAMRIHQWLKNLLLFTVLFVSRAFLDPAQWIPVIGAFVAFGLCASATYIWNDLFDLKSDRKHAKKHTRPFASGAISALSGLLISVLLLAASAAVSLLVVTPAFLLVLAGYIGVTVTYSLLLKRKHTADVLTLGFLYAYRMFAGGVAIAVMPSSWLFSFSIFFFVSLGFVKRMTELPIDPGEDNPMRYVTGRGYAMIDRAAVMALGIASGFSSLIIFALYINSPQVMETYQNAPLLWAVCFLLLYWMSRIWILTNRGEMNDDPIVFAMRDKVSILTGGLVVAIVFLAGLDLGAIL